MFRSGQDKALTAIAWRIDIPSFITVLISVRKSPLLDQWKKSCESGFDGHCFLSSSAAADQRTTLGW
jgi:hypothetical protein